MSMHRLLDHYRGLLLDVAEEAGGLGRPGDRLREVLRRFERDLAQVPEESASQYSVLRRGLEESQRRCEVLNGDMLRQADANEEILGTLTSVKESNRRLLEQVRNQADEISALTQKRVSDEEKMEQMARKHKHVEEQLRAEHCRGLTAAKQAHEAAYASMEKQLGRKVAVLSAGVLEMQGVAGELRRVQREAKKQARDYADASHRELRGLELKLTEVLATTQKKGAGERSMMRDTIEHLEVSLSREKEAHTSALASLNQRLQVATAESEDLNRSLTTRLAELEREKDSSQGMLQEERQTWALTRQQLEAQVANLERSKKSLESTADTGKRDVVRLEASVMAAETEVKLRDTQLAEVKRQLGELEEKLGHEREDRDLTRKQAEEHRARLISEHTSEVKSLEAQHQDALATLQDGRDRELTHLKKELAALTEAQTRRGQEVERLQTSVEEKVREAAGNAREAAMWKAQYEGVDRARGQAAQEVAVAQEKWAAERSRLEESTLRLTRERDKLEEDFLQMEGELQRLQHSAGAEVREARAQVEALTDAHREAVQGSEEMRRKLADAQDTAGRCKHEVAAAQQRIAEARAELAREWEQKARELQDHNQHLQHELQVQRAEGAEIRATYEGWRETHVRSLQHLQGDLQRKDEERKRVEQKSRAEAAELRGAAAAAEERADHLEQDLSRVRYLLTEARAGLAHLQAVKDREHHSSMSTFSGLEEERRRLAEAVKRSEETEGRLQRELETAQAKSEADRLRYERELADLRAQATETLAREREDACNLRTAYERELSLSQSRFHDARDAERERFVATSRENDELKSVLEAISPPSVMAVQSQLDDHINRLQSRTAQLRQEMGHSTAQAASA